ncbi:hypothetical protein ACH0BU_16465 [Sphingomonas olei]
MTMYEIAQFVDELTKLVEHQGATIAHLTEKLNRVEAAIADAKPVEPVSKGESIDVAVELLDRAIAANERQNETFRTMMMDIRRGR